MEAVLGVLMIAAFVGGIVIVVALAIALVAMIARNVANAPPPSELGRAVGLVPAGPRDAVADRDGIRVHAKWTTVSRGSGKNRRQVRVMRYWAVIDPPLRMGLGIGREGLLDGFFDSLGVSGDVQVGDPELDRALRIRALEPAHVAALLADPDAKRALLAGVAYGTFGVDDDRVATGHDRWVRSADELGRAIEIVHAIARALRASRARARASWEPRLEESWGAIARTESMQWIPERSRLAARAGDAWVTLEIQVVKGALTTALALRFGTPLGIGLDVYKTGMGAQIGALFGAQDVECGHRAFDDAFTVKASDAATARHVLAEGGADAIVRLASIFPEVRAGDRGADASIGTLLLDPRTAGQAMRAAIDLARALRGGGAAASEGAYR